MANIGIIGGSGIYEMKGLQKVKDLPLETPFGKPSDNFKIVKIGGKDVVFLPRHNSSHNIPPHMINYRANIWGMRKLGVKTIIATGSVGSISSLLTPGDLVLPDQIIDMTKNRPTTFFDSDAVYHVDFTEPYCPALREFILKSAAECNIPVLPRGTYVCTEGPRFETRAEIKLYGQLGSDMVGMTQMPEAILARELELCYATIATVTNNAAGISKEKLTTSEVIDAVRKVSQKLNNLLFQVVSEIDELHGCTCKNALKNAKL
ncbi:MAG: S-methyl-5'-thioadenosine phosphorylase [Nitrospirae bacterium]|nr:S-methyl-5'-thioadenosine phosphorylase [Nitrospirota bacterium]MBF0535343.1 S-methyl-5'-thioadenosine phosphorylase [Nitrospirota bacterium]MBF0616864.1 S-methyl-5'-thioadenosine phosphorylase [Nitrospirota bacterium]